MPSAVLHFPMAGHHVSATPRMSSLSLIISHVKFGSLPASKRLLVFHFPLLKGFLKFSLESFKTVLPGDPNEELIVPENLE